MTADDDEFFDELQQELAQLENALDLDDDDALFAMLDEIHERNVEELEEFDESDDKDELVSFKKRPKQRRYGVDVDFSPSEEGGSSDEGSIRGSPGAKHDPTPIAAAIPTPTALPTVKAFELSPVDEEIAGQYHKMLKMGMPMGAVQQKMLVDGVAQHIQDSVANAQLVEKKQKQQTAKTGIDLMQNLGSDFDQTGSVMTPQELANMRKKRGQCVTCGQKCFKKKVFKMIPLDVPGLVKNGKCLKCTGGAPAAAAVGARTISLPARGVASFPTARSNTRAGSASKPMSVTATVAPAPTPVATAAPAMADVASYDDFGANDGGGGSVPPSDLPQIPPPREPETSAVIQGNHATVTSNTASDATHTKDELKKAIEALDNNTTGKSEELERSMEVFATMTLIKADHSFMLDQQVPRTISKAMNANLDNIHLQKLGCSAVYNLAGTSRCQEDFVKGGIMDPILTTMESNMNDAAFQEQALSTIANLAATKNNLNTLVENSGLERVIESMNAHTGNPKILAKACQAVANMAAHESSKKKKLMEDAGGAIIIAMVMNPNHVGLLESALRALRHLSSGNDENKTEMANNGGVDSIISAMKVHRDVAGVQLEGAWTLCNLATTEENKEIIGDCGGIDVVVTGLQSQERRVLEKCLRALFNLSLDSHNAGIVIEVGGINATITAMQAHPDSPGIQEVACGILFNLSDVSDDNRIQIVDEEALDALVLTMVLHSDDKEVQKRACLALKGLCIPDNFKPMFAANIVELVTVAGEKFEECKPSMDFILSQMDGDTTPEPGGVGGKTGPIPDGMVGMVMAPKKSKDESSKDKGSSSGKHKVSGSHSVAGDKIKRGEIHVRPDGKKVRRVKKPKPRATIAADNNPEKKENPETEIFTRPDGTKVRRIRRAKASSSVAGDQIAVDKSQSLTGEVYVRADGKKVRRVQKVSAVQPGDQVEIITRPDGTKVRRIKRVKGVADQPTPTNENIVGVTRANPNKGLGTFLNKAGGGAAVQRTADGEEYEIYTRPDGKKVRRIKRVVKRGPDGKVIPVGPSAKPACAATVAPSAAANRPLTTGAATVAGDMVKAIAKPEISSAAVKLNAVDEDIAGQYRKMLKMGMPGGAVQQKMLVDGISQHIIDVVIAKPAAAPAAPTPAAAATPAPAAQPAVKYSQLSPADEEIAGQYRKMLKMGMPMGAVQQKMLVDGMAQHIQDSVAIGEVPAPAGAAPAPAPVAPVEPAVKYSSLSPADEEIASRFRKMLKMGMPIGAVSQKMMTEGVSQSIQDSVANGEVPRPAGGTIGHIPDGMVLVPKDQATVPEGMVMVPKAQADRTIPEGMIAVDKDKTVPDGFVLVPKDKVKGELGDDLILVNKSQVKDSQLHLGAKGDADLKKGVAESDNVKEAKSSNVVSTDDLAARVVELKREGKTFLLQALPDDAELQNDFIQKNLLPKDIKAAAPAPAAAPLPAPAKKKEESKSSIADVISIIDVFYVNDLPKRMEKLKREGKAFLLQELQDDANLKLDFTKMLLLPFDANPPGRAPTEAKTPEKCKSTIAKVLAQMSAMGGNFDAEKIGELLQNLEESEKRQKKLEKQLAGGGVAIAEDIDYDVCLKKIAEIGKRMGEIGSSDVVHPDKDEQIRLREEYLKLEQDMEKYSNALVLTDEYVAEQQRKEKEWDEDNAADNLEALKKLRRHMPVEVRNMSEAQLTNEPSPNGQFLPAGTAKKFKRTNVLQIIRRDPDDLARMHPSTLESMRVTGLTLTERRAVYEHVRGIGPIWEAGKAKKETERKWTWFNMMKNNFKENLESYKRHVAQYGPPGAHQGCPLLGKQCSLMADKLIDYDGDYGWTDEAVYEVSVVKKADVEDAGARAKAGVLELMKENKASERVDALKKHYKGKRLQVSKANGSCESMDEIMDRMELGMEKWIGNILDLGDDKSKLTDDVKKKEVANFSDVLNDCKLSIYDFCGRAGIRYPNSEQKDEKPDPRSSIECLLAEEVRETFEIFSNFIAHRMEKTDIVDTNTRKASADLTNLLNDLHERNIKTLEVLGVEKEDRSRPIKTVESITKECKGKFAARVSSPDPVGRGGGGRGGLLDTIEGGRGRGRSSGARGGLLDAIAGRGGRGRGRSGLVARSGGGLLDAVAARGGRGRGRSGSSGRGGLLDAIYGRGRKVNSQKDTRGPEQGVIKYEKEVKKTQIEVQMPQGISMDREEQLKSEIESSLVPIQGLFRVAIAKERTATLKKNKKRLKRLGKKSKKAAVRIQALVRGALQRGKNRSAEQAIPIPEEIAIIIETATRVASHKSKLRKETLQFLDTLHGYLVCRGKMDAKYTEIDEFQIIAKHEIKADTSEMLADTNDPLLYRSMYQQQSIQGRSVKTLSELYEAAERTKPIYQEIVHEAVRKLQLEHSDAVVGVTVKLCDLKGKQRALEKAEDDYAKRRPRPGVSWLYDIVRGSVEFTSAQHVVEFLDLIQQEPSIRIVKAKNRFTEPSLTGYRDLNIQFQVHTGKGFYHICELQIHHKAIKELDVELHTHMYYEFFRSYFAGATASLKERLEVLKLISDGGAIDDSFLKELLQTSNDVERLERLGVLFRDQLCEYQWAFRVFVRLFDIRKDHYGTRHPEVARSYTDMALVLKEQGKLDEAIELYQESLSIYKAACNYEHPSVAKVYFHMALVLKDQEKLVESMDLFEKSLLIDIECNGKESFSVANTYTHMAAVLRKQGKLDEAMDLFQKSLDSKRRLVGDLDSSIADTLQNIAIILKQKGRLEESENLFRESIDIATKTMGENHSSVAVGYRNMALVLEEQGKLRKAVEKQGKLTEALEFYKKSLAIYRKNVGEKHLLVADVYNDMAYSYNLRGEKGKAKGLLLKSLNIKKKLFSERMIEAVLRKKIANQRCESHIGPLTPRVVTA